MLGPDGKPIEPEPTRFLPQRRPGRYIIAAVVTTAVGCGVALVVALTMGTTGPNGVGLFFAAVGAVVVGLVVVMTGVEVGWAPTRRLPRKVGEGGRFTEAE